MELSLIKGEIVVLTRRVDANWYEGRIGSRKGIFPSTYIEILQEPGETRGKGYQNSKRKLFSFCRLLVWFPDFFSRFFFNKKVLIKCIPEQNSKSYQWENREENSTTLWQKICQNTIFGSSRISFHSFDSIFQGSGFSFQFLKNYHNLTIF